MEISVKEQEQYLTFNLKGRLDLTSSTELKEKVKEFLNQGKKNILLKLSKVDFINSSGLGTVMGCLTSMKNNDGELKLSGATDKVKSLFIITKLITLFEAYDSIDDAVESFGT